MLTERYCLLPADLRDLAQLEAALAAAGLDPAAPTYVVSECVLVYLKPQHRCGDLCGKQHGWAGLGWPQWAPARCDGACQPPQVRLLPPQTPAAPAARFACRSRDLVRWLAGRLRHAAMAVYEQVGATLRCASLRLLHSDALPRGASTRRARRLLTCARHLDPRLPAPLFAHCVAADQPARRLWPADAAEPRVARLRPAGHRRWEKHPPRCPPTCPPTARLLHALASAASRQPSALPACRAAAVPRPLPPPHTLQPRPTWRRSGGGSPSVGGTAPRRTAWTMCTGGGRQAAGGGGALVRGRCKPP